MLLVVIASGILWPATAAPSQTRSKASEFSGPPNMSYGSNSAPITMEVFSDYQCPSCRALYEQTLRPLINDYVASGKVYLVHRDFPLSAHKYGYEAARWVNAAARVGEFANAEAALYDNQPAWSAGGDIQKYVAGAMPNADFKRVQKIMESCEGPPASASLSGAHLMDVAVEAPVCPLDKYINEDRAMGMKIPVQATPTYVITYKGQRLPAGSGVVSWPILKQFFDSLLSQ
jgi:protein-disulfide isomerase